MVTMLRRNNKHRAALSLGLYLSVMCVAFGSAARGSDLFESIKDNREQPVRAEQVGGTPGDTTGYFGDTTGNLGEYYFLFDEKPTLWSRIKGRFTDGRLAFGDFFNLFFLTSPTVEFFATNLLSFPNTLYQHYKMACEGADIRQQMRREVQQARRDSYSRAMQVLGTIMSMKAGSSAAAEKNKEQVLDNLLTSGVPPEVVDEHMGHLNDKIDVLKKAEAAARRKVEQKRLRRRSAVLKTPRISQLEPENGRLGYSWCGPTSLRMIYAYYGRKESTRDIANRIYDWKGHTGTYSTSIVSDAKKHGFPNTYIKTSCDFEFLAARLNEGKPIIVNVDVSYKYGHYMVLVGLEGDRVILNDPYYKGVRREMSRSAFLADWDGRSRRCIVVQK